MTELSDACKAWQSGRDGGSSLLRGAARVLTGVPHYFQASYIDDYEEKATSDKSGTALAHGRALLQAVRESEPLTAAEWNTRYSLAPGDFAGRGIKSKQEPKSADQQIEAALASGQIIMPLWGVSLDRDVADSYGTRFRFVVHGPFHGVAAWAYSGTKDNEHEIIAGGTYRVDDITHDGETTVATLSEIRPQIS